MHNLTFKFFLNVANWPLLLVFSFQGHQSFLFTFSCWIPFERSPAEPEFLKFQGAPESIPRNQIQQHMQPGWPVRQPYSYSAPSPHRLFKNSSPDHGGTGKTMKSRLCWIYTGVSWAGGGGVVQPPPPLALLRLWYPDKIKQKRLSIGLCVQCCTVGPHAISNFCLFL